MENKYEIGILEIEEKNFINKDTGEIYPFIESSIKLNYKKFILLPLKNDKELYKYFVKELYSSGKKEIALVIAEQKTYIKNDTGEIYPYYESSVEINNKKFILNPLKNDKELYKYFVKDFCNKQEEK